MLASTILMAGQRRFALHTDLHIPDSFSNTSPHTKVSKADKRINTGDLCKLASRSLSCMCCDERMELLMVGTVSDNFKSFQIKLANTNAIRIACIKGNIHLMKKPRE
jgi:hypothetical protein